MIKNSRNLTLARVLDITKALSELYLLVEKDPIALKLFEKGVETTGALSCSLDELIAEWQTVANNIQLDTQSLYESWSRSAKLFKDVDRKTTNTSHFEDMEVEPYDIVFEDNSYIETLFEMVDNKPKMRFSIAIGADNMIFTDLDEAKRYLWEDHSKYNYGV